MGRVNYLYDMCYWLMNMNKEKVSFELSRLGFDFEFVRAARVGGSLLFYCAVCVRI